MSRTLRDLPGPRPWPLLGNPVALRTAHLQFEAWAHEFGNFFRFRVGPVHVVGVTDPEVARAVLQQRPERYTRIQRTNEIMYDLALGGVFASEGETWRRQRRLLNPSFHARHLDTFADSIRVVTERLRQYWLNAAQRADPSGEDVLGDLMRYTVDVTSVVSFGLDLDTVSGGGDALQRQLAHVFQVVERRSNSPFDYWKLPLVGIPTRLRMRRLERFLRDLIVQARQRLASDPARREQPPTLLESMLVATDEEARHPLSDTEVAANVLTVLLAGEDTTANTLAFALYHLAMHPDVTARAREEVDAALGDAFVPTLEQARELSYVEAIAHETLRLTPPTPLIPVQATEDVVIDGLALPAGTVLMLLTRLMATSPGVFDDPSSFRPERWLEGDAEQRRHHRRMMLAFGGGPRVCPGRGLALLECAMVLAMVLRTFDFELADPSVPLREVTQFTVQPSGVRVRFRPRGPQKKNVG